MRFKLDENLPIGAALLLASLGHNAMTVGDQSLGGERDDRLINICAKEKRALITLDLDFADIRTHPPETYAGIIVLRPRMQNKESVLSLLSSICPIFDTEVVEKRLWIVDEEKIRIRGES